jgi:adenylate cyclase
MRLSPLDPLGYDIVWGLGLAALVDGRYEEAIEWADRCMREEPTYLPAFSLRLVACGSLDRAAEAHETLGRLLELDPGYTVRSFEAIASRFFTPVVVALYTEGLRKAGVPEE